MELIGLTWRDVYLRTVGRHCLVNHEREGETRQNGNRINTRLIGKVKVRGKVKVNNFNENKGPEGHKQYT